MKTIIVGGGIAGLTLAAVLHKLGDDDFVVIEKAPTLRETGAGIQIASNAMHVFDWLGLREEVMNIAHMNQGNVYRNLDDDSIVKYVATGTRLEELYGAPSIQVNRQNLAVLLEKQIPADKIRYSATCIEIRQGDGSASVTLESGETLIADFVIGADGIHSQTRRAIFGVVKNRLSTAGWRAMIPKEKAESIPLAKWSHVWFGNGKSAVAYWINGGEHLNFVGSVFTTESQSRDWRELGSVDELRKIYAGTSPVIEDVVSRIEEAFVTDIFSTDPLESYVQGQIALIGDAAHPMMPYLAAGAGQGIEDAFALGVSLARSDAPLAEYDQMRCARGNQVQSASEKMSILYHGTDDEAPNISDTGFESSENHVQINDFRTWLWGYNIVQEMGLIPQPLHQ